MTDHLHRNPRQTLSFLRNLFEERGIRPKSKLGQNFLVDLNLLDLIVRSSDLSRDDLVIEVGSGTGSLTAQLAENSGAVVSVEIDPAFHTLVEDTIDPDENLVLLRFDILRNKNELNPAVLAKIAEMRQSSGCRHLKLVANLPFAVATPVIANFLISDLPFERMVVTVQWEIAARLLACPDSKDYGALSVLVQSLADVELIRKLPPSVFWPRPQVSSAIVRIQPDAGKRARVGDVLRWRRFLRDLYVHRRKNLRAALVGWPGGRRKKEDVDRLLAEAGISGTCRAEDLDLDHHLKLCEVFGEV